MNNIKFNSERYFYHKGEIYSFYSHCLVDGKLIYHSLGQIPHTIEIKDGWIIITANADKTYSYYIGEDRILNTENT